MDKSSKKSKGQHESSNQKPQPKSTRKATVVISPDSNYKIDVETGNVSDLEMYMFLRDLTKTFATIITKDATEVVGDNPEAQAKYLDWRIEQSGLNSQS